MISKEHTQPGAPKIEVLVGDSLRRRSATIGTAESCTGGLISHLLTNIAGSSEYVLGGIVTYSNQAKINLLNVNPQTIMNYGAVSEEVAYEMAIGAREILRADYVVSVTGIAGPSGGTLEKPVGLTFIGLAGPDDLLVVKRHIWEGDRLSNKNASAKAALQLVLRYLNLKSGD
jgi:PncC family amidohydrolase